MLHDDVVKWKHFPCYWPFVQDSTGQLWNAYYEYNLEIHMRVSEKSCNIIISVV